MHPSVSRIRGARAFITLLALTTGAGALHATNVLTATSPITVSCNTATGPGTAATIVVKPVTTLTGSGNIVVTFAAPGSGIVVTAPSVTTLSTANQSAGLSYSVNVAAGCASASTGAVTLHFSANLNAGGAAADVTTTINNTVTATTSALVANPSTVTISCSYDGATYLPGPPQTITVTSAATGGTPFTLDTTVTYDPTWLVVNPTAPAATATQSPSTFTVAAASGCGGFASGTTHTVMLHLLSAPAPVVAIPLTFVVAPYSPLTVTPVPSAPSIALTYVKGSGSAGTATVSVTSTVPSTFFAINTATMPSWLSASNISGTTPLTLVFSTNNLADTLAPGGYNATIYMKVSGFGDLAVPISLQVNNKAPKLSVNATNVPITWVVGSAIPTATIVATSSDSPIQYSTTTGGTLQPAIGSAQQAGLAYSFGTDIAVTFNSLVFASATPGSILTGVVTLTWGSPAVQTAVTFTVTVASPGATLYSLSPASLPTASTGTQFTVVLNGSGFVGGTDASLKTKVGIIVGGVIVTDTNFSVNVLGASTIALTITVPASGADATLFSVTGTGGSETIGVCNGNCTVPTGNSLLTVSAGPIIQGITSASSFTEVAPPSLPTIAPYDMLSLFGTSFCSSGGTGCGSAQILTGAPDSLTLRFPTTLSPDAVSSTQRLVSVSFLQHGTTTLIANAPLLFATNGQINLIVPAAVGGFVGADTVDVVVNFGYGSGATLLSSVPFPINIANTDPGVFTIGSDGQGSGAALNNANYTLITSSRPGAMRTTATDSDVIQLYVTGLGAPNSTASDLSAGSNPSLVPTDCIAAVSGTGNYESVLQSATSVSPSLTSIDGAVIQSSLLASHRLPPCFTTNPTVKIGGVSATVKYAGFVPDSVAGLYQINVQLPSPTGTFYPLYPLTAGPITNVLAPQQLPVQVTMNSVTSQPGVTVWVQPSLQVVGPTGSNLNATVGIAYSQSVTATEGASPYQYSISSGQLPAGLTLNSTSGLISGEPAANTAGSYAVTISAMDSANVPVTGSVAFTMVVAGGLFVTSSGSSPFNATFGTADTAFSTVAATGGTYPYTYVITTPGSLPAGLTINSSTGVISTTSSTPAGTYNIIVTATDSAGTPLTGMASFSLVVALHMAHGSITTQAASSGSTLVQVTATGNTGTLIYTLDSASVTAGLAIDSSGNVTTGTATAAAYMVTVTATDSVTMATGSTSFGVGTIGPLTLTVD